MNESAELLPRIPTQQTQEQRWTTELHRCLIRHLLALRAQHGRAWFRDEIKQWKQWPSLEPDFVSQWQRGNQNKSGDWRKQMPKSKHDPRRSAMRRRINQTVRLRGHELHTPYTHLDVLAASGVNPMPEAARTRWLTSVHLALDDLERVADPDTREWWSVAGAVNLMQALVQAGHLMDDSGCIADCHEALGKAGQRHLAGQRMGLDGPGIQTLRALLADLDEAMQALPHRTLVQAHINAARHVARLVNGAPPKAGDVVVQAAKHSTQETA